MAQNNENTEQSCAAVTLCSGGCGFFGNTQFDGMCSKCYKDALKRKQATNPPQEPAGRSSPISAAALSAAASYLSTIGSGNAALTKLSNESQPSTSLSSKTLVETAVNDHVAASSATASASSPKPSEDKAAGTSDDRPDTPTTPSETKTKKRNRCSSCKKKVGLTGFECRCGGLYCSMHRYSDKHDCQFDYKKEGEDLIRKNNPVVVGSKLQKI